MYRDLFPVTNTLAYLNHAAVGPLSIRAYEAMERHARDQRDYGALHWRDWYAEYDRYREAAAKLTGAQPNEIAIVKNTSEGISFVAEGLRWREGENAITTALEFPSNYTPWLNLARRGVETRVAALPTVDAIEPLIDANTRIVTVSSVAFHNGFTADLDAIGELCASRGVLFCVDAIQSLGVLPLDVKRSKIAFLAADGHKWMCGPEGAGIFFVDAQHLERLDVLENGWTNVDRHGKFLDVGVEWLPDSRRFEAGSTNTNGVYGMRAALELLLEVGIDEIAARALGVARSIVDVAESIGWTVASPQPVQSPIVGIVPPAGEERSLLWWHRRLEEAGVVSSPREGMLRLSPHFYNDASDVDRLAAAMQSAS